MSLRQNEGPESQSSPKHETPAKSPFASATAKSRVPSLYDRITRSEVKPKSAKPPMHKTPLWREASHPNYINTTPQKSRDTTLNTPFGEAWTCT